MEIFLYFILFVASAFILVRSGTILISSLTYISRMLGWGEFVVAFILLAFASSLPELFVGISSALHGVPEISFGDVIGANVIDFTLAIAIAVFVLKGLDVKRAIVRRDVIISVFAAMLPLLLILDGRLSRIDGIILLVGFVVYTLWVFSQREHFTKQFNNLKNWHDFRLFLIRIGLFMAGIAGVLIGAELMIRSVLFFAERFHISQVIIGTVIVGGGTALPEVYFAIRAALSGYKGMILGSLMGAIVVPSLFVLGLVALISPFEIQDFAPYSAARLFLILGALAFLVFVHTGRRVSMREAFVLVAIYIGFLVTQLFFV